MYQRPSPPATEAAVFEADYLAATLRARRDFTWAQRAATIAVLTGAPPDPKIAAPEFPEPRLRSFSLILARCESAATLLGWRKQIVPDQKRLLDAAVQRLQEAAAQVAVRESVQPVTLQRAKAKYRPLSRPLQLKDVRGLECRTL